MALEGYLEELADTSRPLRTSGLTNLTQLSLGEREEVDRAWRGLDADRRLQIVQRLTDLGEDNPELNFNAIFFVALEDPDSRVRAAAIEGLWEYDERDLVPRLLRLLHLDEGSDVRANAALALGRFVVLGEFGSLPEPDLIKIEDALTESINDGAEVEEVRARALESIGARSEPWVRDLITDAYTSGSHRMQVSAIHAMGRSCDPEWLPDIIQQMQSDDAELRYEAATAAGMIADEAAVPHLAFLVDDDDSEVQEMAIESLGEIGGSEARGILRRLLEMGDERIQDVARDALASIDLAALDDEDTDELN